MAVLFHVSTQIAIFFAVVAIGCEVVAQFGGSVAARIVDTDLRAIEFDIALLIHEIVIGGNLVGSPQDRIFAGVHHIIADTQFGIGCTGV